MDGYCANKNGYIVIKLYGEIPYSEPFSPGIGPSLCPPSGSWESLWPIAAGSHSPRNPKFGRVRFFFLGSLASSCLFFKHPWPISVGLFFDSHQFSRAHSLFLMTSQFGYRLQSILAFIPKVSCLFPPLASGFV